MKQKTNIYWDDEIEQKVCEYVQEQSPIKRDYIFSKYLHKPLNKLIDSITHKYTLYKFDHTGIDDIRQQCMFHIIDYVLKKYDPIKGRSFSYIGTSVRRFLWQKVLTYNKLDINSISIDSDLSVEYGNLEPSKSKDNNVLNSISHSYNIDNDDDFAKDVLNKFIESLKEEYEMLENINEKNIRNWLIFLNSFVLLVETNKSIPFIDNKVSFYNSLKKINGMTESKNYKYVQNLKDRYDIFLKNYLET